MPENSTIVVEHGVRLGGGHAEQRGVEVDVLPAGEVGVESRAELEQGRDPAAAVDARRRSPR